MNIVLREIRERPPLQEFSIIYINEVIILIFDSVGEA